MHGAVVIITLLYNELHKQYVFSNVYIMKLFTTIKRTSIKLYDKQMLQKKDKGGMTTTKMYTFLEQNIRVFLRLHKLTHGLTFGIINFL